MFETSKIVIASCLLGTVSLMGCTPESTSRSNQSSDRLGITVSIAPQKYFVERIGGDRVNVNVMIRAGIDPHTYEPKPEQLRSLSESQIYFSIGTSLEEAWIDRLAGVNSQMAIVDTSQGVEKLPMVEHEHGHSEDKEHEEERETLDSHIWLSPQRVKVQARTIYESLVELDPSHEEEYRANLESFLQDIGTLDKEIRQTLAGLKQRKFMVFHPEWGYFAKDYGLEMISIEVNGTEPSAAELADLIAEAKEEDIRVIFVQPEFSTKSAETIAREINGQVIPISAFSPDWSDNLRQVSAELAKTLNQSRVIFWLITA